MLHEVLMEGEYEYVLDDGKFELLDGLRSVDLY